MLVSFAVVLTLTFMDGTFAQYNNGDWPIVSDEKHAVAFELCQKKMLESMVEMRKEFKDQTEPKPSTFMKGCVLQQE
jgi:hypothetical protein